MARRDWFFGGVSIVLLIAAGCSGDTTTGLSPGPTGALTGVELPASAGVTSTLVVGPLPAPTAGAPGPHVQSPAPSASSQPTLLVSLPAPAQKILVSQPGLSRYWELDVNDLGIAGNVSFLTGYPLSLTFAPGAAPRDTVRVVTVEGGVVSAPTDLSVSTTASPGPSMEDGGGVLDGAITGLSTDCNVANRSLHMTDVFSVSSGCGPPPPTGLSCGSFTVMAVSPSAAVNIEEDAAGKSAVSYYDSTGAWISTTATVNVQFSPGSLTTLTVHAVMTPGVSPGSAPPGFPSPGHAAGSFTLDVTGTAFFFSALAP